MKLTESAVSAILEVMHKRKLEPATMFFEIKMLNNGAIGIGFSKTPEGIVSRYGALNVSIDYRIDTTEIVVDYGEVNGKTGIIFMEEHT